MQNKNIKWLRWAYVGVLVGLVVGISLLDLHADPLRFASLAGLFGYMILGWACSINHKVVQWRPVVTGCVAQLILALLILRTTYEWGGVR